MDDYSLGDSLTNGVGVIGGRWSMPKEAWTQVVSLENRKCMGYTTSTNGLVFSPQRQTVDGQEAVVMSVRMTGYGKPLSDSDLMAENAAAAFAIAPPSMAADESPAFLGWSKAGWQVLQHPSLRPEPDRWYDVSMRFRRCGAEKAKVQYRVKTGAEFEPLQTTNGLYWLDIAVPAESASVANEIEVRGEGHFEFVGGSEMQHGLIMDVKKNP